MDASCLVTNNTSPDVYLDTSVTVNPPTTGAVPLEFDITAIVQNWASGNYANYGIFLASPAAVLPAYNAFRNTIFYSLGWYDSSYQRPALDLEYQ